MTLKKMFSHGATHVMCNTTHAFNFVQYSSFDLKFTWDLFFPEIHNIKSDGPPGQVSSNFPTTTNKDLQIIYEPRNTFQH